MTLYRAAFVTKGGTVRRMTFSVAGGIKAAHAFAQGWELRDDRLDSVQTARDLQRPAFQLQSDLLNQQGA